jgi:adhesin transport system membrane fusion protein
MVQTNMEETPISKPKPTLLFPKAVDSLKSSVNGMFLYSVSIGLVALLVWSFFAKIDVVARGSGRVVPSLQNQIVQHFEGGIVTDILVFEGQTVREGDVLMRIENPFSEAEYTRTNRELLAKKAELIRLKAESARAEVLNFPIELERDFPDITANEHILFERRKDSLEELILIYKDQQTQKQLEKSEKRKRLENMRLEYGLIKRQVDNLSKLVKVGAASENTLLKIKSNLQQIQTKISDLEHQIPKTDVEISELLRRQQETILSFQSEAETEKNKVLRKADQLKETLYAMKDRKKRTEVTAPINGKIHRVFQATSGGVVRSGQNLVQIVPSDSAISIEVKLSPKDRAKVWVNLPAIAKLSAYDFTSFGGINAQVTDISNDTLQDGDGEPYFRVKLEADASQLANEMTIIAGMAAEVDIITGKRTIMDYLIKPFRDVYGKALRES